MPDFTTIGKVIMGAGGVVIIVGAVFWLIGKFGLPLGRLPGDIHIERGGGTIFIPLATSILLSLLLTLIVNIIFRFLNH